MQSRAAEYRMHAVVCAAQASAAPDPMKQFYQALELQWVCLAQPGRLNGCGASFFGAENRGGYNITLEQFFYAALLV